MALRCFLFSSDEGTSDIIRQAMTGLDLEGDSCSQATVAVEKLAKELFQLVVIDWNQQPEAGMLVSAARERKASERPLVLAIVSEDASAPKALQAGANSILRKPLSANQVTDTLRTARDLLRSRQESVASAASAAAAGVSSTSSVAGGSAAQPSLRAGEFPQSVPNAPSGQIETDSEVAHFPEQTAAEETNPLKDLEPMAAAVQESSAPPPPPDEPKGLEWYLKARGVIRQPGSVMATSSAPAKPEQPELLGYDQPPSTSDDSRAIQGSRSAQSREASPHEEKQEAQLFSYINGENRANAESSKTRFSAWKKGIIAALVLAACATVAAPQAPWHGKLVESTARGRRALHSWLNPQPVTVVTQAPASHEDFGRAGDEYKLPVAENIPDATTDPSQISVLPVIDPTAKKPATDANTVQPAATPDGAVANATDGNPTSPAPGPTSVPVGTAPEVPQPVGPAPIPSPAPDTPVHLDPSAANPPVAITTPSAKPSAVVPRAQAQYPAPTKVPSSLKSQMAPMVPDAGGNKPAEAALPAIEPVSVPELTERSLLLEQPPLVYPANAAGKQGTVTLQVLIGRDGMVQDAKFVQGSLIFARSAIDGVKQWKFKPYTMNGRPVSVETSLTLKLAPAQ
jgi:periplasmic protein TonB